jgi:hypothetical protein
MSIGQTVYVYASTHNGYIPATVVSASANGILVETKYGPRIVKPAQILRTQGAL